MLFCSIGAFGIQLRIWGLLFHLFFSLLTLSHWTLSPAQRDFVLQLQTCIFYKGSFVSSTSDPFLPVVFQVSFPFVDFFCFISHSSFLFLPFSPLSQPYSLPLLNSLFAPSYPYIYFITIFTLHSTLLCRHPQLAPLVFGRRP